MKNVSLLFLVIVVIAGCNKNSEPGSPNVLELNGKFQTEKTVYLKPAVMYVQNRQITDQGIINAYLSRHGYSSYFSSASTQTITDTALAITFGNNDSVSLKAASYPGVYAGKKMQNGTGEWVIQNNDTTKIFIDPYPPVTYRCDSLSGMVTKIKSIFLYQVFYGGTGYYALQSHVFRFPLQVINNELIYPQLAIVTNTIWNYPSSNGNCSMGVPNSWNIKNDQIENNLLPKDTIVIQEKSIRMIKIQ